MSHRSQQRRGDEGRGEKTEVTERGMKKCREAKKEYECSRVVERYKEVGEEEQEVRRWVGVMCM